MKRKDPKSTAQGVVLDLMDLSNDDRLSQEQRDKADELSWMARELEESIEDSPSPQEPKP